MKPDVEQLKAAIQYESVVYMNEKDELIDFIMGYKELDDILSKAQTKRKVFGYTESVRTALTIVFGTEFVNKKFLNCNNIFDVDFLKTLDNNALSRIKKYIKVHDATVCNFIDKVINSELK